jgi:hypothetical protein
MAGRRHLAAARNRRRPRRNCRESQHQRTPRRLVLRRAPGIGAALTAAGRALADPDLAKAGHRAIDALADRAAGWDTEGPTICHGSAGVLLCAQAAGSSQSRLPFCFQHSDHGRATDEPGLLVGAAGIALALAEQGGLPPPSHHADGPPRFSCPACFTPRPGPRPEIGFHDER